MTKKPFDPVWRLTSDRGVSLNTRLETVRYLNEIKFRRRTVPIHGIADALVAAGYTSLDNQAKALGLKRATAWTIIKTKHKLGRLNTKTAKRILENPDTPLSVCAIIQQALAESFDAAQQSRDENK